jgi:uncharacterized protein DUF4242
MVLATSPTALVTSSPATSDLRLGPPPASRRGRGVRWLFSFPSADRRRTYCLYEAPSPEAIMAAAHKANVPADAIVEVDAATPQFAGRLSEWADAVG